METDLGMSLVLSSTQAVNYLSDGMGKSSIYRQKGRAKNSNTRGFQKTGDNNRIYLHSSLHPSMEHVFSHYTAAATISALVWWTSSHLPFHSDFTGLYELETGWLWVFFFFLISSYWLRCLYGLWLWLGHINNLYNTTFWAMVQKGGISNTDAELELKVSFWYPSSRLGVISQLTDEY